MGRVLAFTLTHTLFIITARKLFLCNASLRYYIQPKHVSNSDALPARTIRHSQVNGVGYLTLTFGRLLVQLTVDQLPTSSCLDNERPE